MAYSIDTIIIGAIGLAVGFRFYVYFLSLGQFGRLYGLIIYLGYFATLNSRLGNGQTLGKRILGIKVVDRDANPLSFPQSIIRQSIIATPIFLNGLNVAAGPNAVATSIILGIAVFGTGGTISYFLIFNRKTRRSLHDFVCGSNVVRVEQGKTVIDESHLWRGHFAILGTVAVAAIAGGIFISSWAQNNFDMTKVMALYEKLNQQDEIRQSGVHLNKTYRLRDGEKSAVTVLQVIAMPPYQIDSNNEYAMIVMGIALEDESLLPESDIISLGIITGFDLGIARERTTRSVSDTPQNWKTAVESYKKEGTVPNIRFSTNTQIRF